jgi:hypothetical protein
LTLLLLARALILGVRKRNDYHERVRIPHSKQYDF